MLYPAYVMRNLFAPSRYYFTPSRMGFGERAARD